MLVASGVRKRYGGVRALAGVGLRLAPGEVHGLLGENGAGKSTLVKILAGVTQPDEGELTVDGRPVHFAGPREARAAGVAVVSQELSLFPDLDVLGNLFVGDQPTRFGLLDRDEMARRAAPVLAELGLKDLPLHQPLARLSLAEQQLIETCRALLGRPKVVILDEPTSALPAAAAERLAATVRGIAGRGVAVLYVSHFLEEVLALADRVTVLRDGRDVMTGEPAAALTVERLVAAMLGDGPAGTLGGPGRLALPPLPDARELRVDAVSVPGRLESVSFTARQGEVLGLAGLQGAGHTAVLELLWGRVRPSAGQVRLPGGAPGPVSMAQAVRRGVAYVPDDRKRLGLMLEASLAENITSVSWLAGRHGGTLLHPGRMAAVARQSIASLRIRGAPEDPVASLSGGNQQKTVFAKWLTADPSLVLLDDPTRGVDVGAKAEMHGIVRRLAADGKIVLVCSTNLAELAAICDRVLVLQRGRVRGELTGDDLSEQELLRAINQGLRPPP